MSPIARSSSITSHHVTHTNKHTTTLIEGSREQQLSSYLAGVSVHASHGVLAPMLLERFARLALQWFTVVVLVDAMLTEGNQLYNAASGM